MALMVLVHCCGTDPKTLLESSLKSWEGAQLEKVEGLQPKLQETPRIFFGLWSYLAGQTFLAIVLREDFLWAVRNLISEFKAVSGPETVVRHGALCRVHCLRNLVLNPNSIFSLQLLIFDFWRIGGWCEILRMENLVVVGSAQIALSQKTLLYSLPQICLILSNLLKLYIEILLDVGCAQIAWFFYFI